MVAATTLLANTMRSATLAPEQTGEAFQGQLAGLPPAGIANAGTGSSIARFDVAMQQAGAGSAQPVSPTGASAAPTTFPFPPAESAPSSGAGPAVGETYGSQANPGGLTPTSSPALDRQRALRGLDLDRSPVTAPGAIQSTDSRGDSILDGLSRLRSAFDGQTSRLTDASGSWMTREGQLFAVQVEIIKYSLLIDVTSKLTGKSTQTFDTLMKGQ
ncbi:type III secretion system (T3SS) basal body protein I (YscI/HrpB/PscI-like) [Breoghania corrubedonensis]|uniref:Type III secretion system (T3SS) basal body protein I (YscI/HrpB/PscI-like) n=1 Tax=Breoghania corrubedonensis TaxID=665038 RepID=A0A2T5UYU6_9HYPH|nr:EscI/YscI/HrpB family type III secretion system inner rod protein [Breoghania corrubedonensis]PTW56651.1 type III secretion system (T3SS) basal body protein I (YscI/HrpB/PscI-like) [Breoghania corrubedonensis]